MAKRAGELHVAQGDGLGDAEFFAVLGEIALEILGVDLDPALEQGRGEAHEGEVDLGVLPAVVVVDILVADRDPILHLRPGLLRQQLVALHRLEVVRRDALVIEDPQVAFLAETAVFLEGRNVGDALDQFVLADAQALVVGLLQQQGLVDELIEGLLRQVQLFFQGRRELLAVDALVELVQVAVGVLVLGQSDRVAVDRSRQVGVAAVATGALAPDEEDGADEGGDDRPEDELDDGRFLLLADQVEHRK